MQVARVAVTEEQWRAFRHAAVTQGVSVSGYLGRLVEAELRRHGMREVATADLEAGEVDRAIAALADVRAAIAELDSIAGRLARSATAQGASWADVATSLRLTPDAAEA